MALIQPNIEPAVPPISEQSTTTPSIVIHQNSSCENPSQVPDVIPPRCKQTEEPVTRNGTKKENKIEEENQVINIESSPRRGSDNKLVKQTKIDCSVENINNGLSASKSNAATVSRISDKASVDERLAQRRKSLVPMSSMEEENLRERFNRTPLANENVYLTIFIEAFLLETSIILSKALGHAVNLKRNLSNKSAINHYKHMYVPIVFEKIINHL
ncbi:unnamed protein product [Psylliodes chrysocephalus]|uniref:Uncharacterized protein n=1 Tax=Psylliodes chrysocephalus TaxID=3402493 RepID=A0A9P0D4L4_9CUCU|nr:unnamed protein product [Psylliodes chrysocephala]